MLSENSVDWKPCWWKNNGDDNSLRVKTVEMLNMLRVKSNRLVDRKPMWCKTVEILWQCWLNPTPPLKVGICRYTYIPTSGGKTGVLSFYWYFYKMGKIFDLKIKLIISLLHILENLTDYLYFSWNRTLHKGSKFKKKFATRWR